MKGWTPSKVLKGEHCITWEMPPRRPLIAFSFKCFKIGKHFTEGLFPDPWCICTQMFNHRALNTLFLNLWDTHSCQLHYSCPVVSQVPGTAEGQDANEAFFHSFLVAQPASLQISLFTTKHFLLCTFNHCIFIMCRKLREFKKSRLEDEISLLNNC